MLETGSIAPNFTLNDKDGKEITLSNFLGKKVVVYFYPKDNTPGCTRQACAFRDNYQIFEEKNIIVIGISKDGEQSHQNFSQKYNLPFILLSDPDLYVIKKFGVWKEKINFGVKSMGVVRSTFIIDEQGIIEKIFKRAKPDTNAEDILKYLG